MNDSPPSNRLRVLGWASRRIALIVSIALVVLSPRSIGAQTEAELSVVNMSAKSFCDPAIVAFDANLSQVTPGLDTFEQVLATAKAEHEKKSKAGQEATNATAVLAQSGLIWQVTKDQVEAAKAYRAQAAVVLARAKAEPDPVVAAVHYKEAFAKIEAANGWLVKAATTLSLPAQPSEVASRRIDIKDDSEALRQLKKLAQDLGRSGSADGRLGALLQNWDGSAVRAGAIAAPAGNASFGIRRYDEGSNTLTTNDGRTINLRPLEHALAAAAPRVARGPLFRAVSAPGGNTIVQPTPEVMRMLANPETRQKVDNVGGVALEVTFDLLAKTGVSYLRGGQPLIYVERPVMLSLLALYDRLKPYAKSDRDWVGLPDELRYPGGLGRIHGYVLDPSRNDVFIVGAPATNNRDRIDIDTISILLATGWRQGLIPTVSLDPVPSDPAGPQYPRVVNVSPDSIVAKTMLDADYEMKHLTFGLRRVEDVAFKSFVDLIKRSADAEAHAARFWFYPVPLRENTVKLSASGRSVLFASGVQLLTETMAIENGALVGTGQVGRIERQVAESFTAAYPDLARSNQIKPAGIFVRLHGLVDVVTLAVLLRRAGVKYPVLDMVSRLPYRRMAGENTIPAWYQGLSVSIALNDIAQNYTISGGVELRTRPMRQSFDPRGDASITALEQAVDAFRPGRSFATNAVLPIVLAGAVAEADGERRMLAAFRALTGGDNERARQLFANAAMRNPLNIEAWAQLAVALANLGRHAEAARAAARALALDPGDFSVKVLALDVALRADPSRNLSAYGADVVRGLSHEYVARAFGAIAAGQKNKGLAFAEHSLTLFGDNADAYLARAWARGGADPKAERRDIIEAIRILRRQTRDATGSAATPRLAFLLAVSADQRVQRASRYASDVSFLISEMQRAAEEAQEARRLDPAQALATAAEIHARALRVNLLKESGQSATMVPVRQLLKDSLRRFATFPAIHTTHALVAILEEQPQEAFGALNEAIRLAPAVGDIYAMRANVQAQLGRCPGARADIKQAESLKADIGQAKRQVDAACR